MILPKRKLSGGQVVVDLYSVEAGGQVAHGTVSPGEFRETWDREQLEPTQERMELAGWPNARARKWVRSGGNPVWVGEDQEQESAS